MGITLWAKKIQNGGRNCNCNCVDRLCVLVCCVIIILWLRCDMRDVMDV